MPLHPAASEGGTTGTRLRSLESVWVIVLAEYVWIYLEQLPLASWSARNIVSLLFAFLLSLHFYLAGYRIGLSFQRRIICTEVRSRRRIPR